MRKAMPISLIFAAFALTAQVQAASPGTPRPPAVLAASPGTPRPPAMA